MARKLPTRPTWWPEDQPWRPLVCSVCWVDISTCGAGIDGRLYCCDHVPGRGSPEQLTLDGLS